MAPSRASSLQQSDAVAPAPPAPVSLLWGHQLKREHGFLLERMAKVETEHDAFDSRIRSVEAAADAMRSTVENVNRLNDDKDEVDDARAAWIASAETRLELMKDGIEKLKTLQPRVSELEAQYDGVEDQVRQTSSDHQSILQTIRALEAEILSNRGEMGQLPKKNDPNDVRVLARRLDAMESHRREDERKAKAMQDRIAGLERTCQAFQASNNELRARLNDALESRDYPLPSTEGSIPTQLMLQSSNLPFTQVSTQVATQVATQVSQPSNSSYLQVPVSPYRPTHERPRAPFREESPIYSAQVRKKVNAGRVTKPKARPTRPSARIVKTLRETSHSPTLTPDLDAPYRRTHAPNSGKRRKAVPVPGVPGYEKPQTRSQTKSQLSQTQNEAVYRRPSKIVVLKFSQGNRLGPLDDPSQPRSARLLRPTRGMKRAQSPETDLPEQHAKKKRAIAPKPKPVKKQAASQKA